MIKLNINEMVKNVSILLLSTFNALNILKWSTVSFCSKMPDFLIIKKIIGTPNKELGPNLKNKHLIIGKSSNIEILIKVFFDISHKDLNLCGCNLGKDNNFTLLRKILFKIDNIIIFFYFIFYILENFKSFRFDLYQI
jgi:hypothetical protein